MLTELQGFGEFKTKFHKISYHLITLKLCFTEKSTETYV